MDCTMKVVVATEKEEKLGYNEFPLVNIRSFIIGMGLVI
jgi:hypothetical protein